MFTFSRAADLDLDVEYFMAAHETPQRVRTKCIAVYQESSPAAAGRGGGCFEKIDSENFLPVAKDMLPFTQSCTCQPPHQN